MRCSLTGFEKIFMPEDRRFDHLGYRNADLHQSSSPSGHVDINSVRHAAEALFAPKKPLANATAAGSTAAAQQNVRKPRILSAVREQAPTLRAAYGEPNKPSRQRKIRRPRKRVPVSDLARLRTWLKYGMTVRQAADVYGVSESEIERIVQRL
jgi:hypothetical protein